MRIQKIKIPNFDNKPIKIKNPIYYPKPRNPNLPNPYYTCLAIGMSGSGKTFAVCKLLKYVEEYGYYNNDGERVPHRIFLLSPTVQANPIFDSLKELDKEDVYNNYSDKLLQEVLDKIEETKDESEKYQKSLKALKKFNRVKSEYELTAEELILLNAIDFDIHNLPEPKYKIPPCNSIILDDLIGQNDALKATGKSLINNLSVKARHYSVNLFVLAQSVKQIPRLIRAQARLFFLFRYNSNSIIKDLYESVSAVLTEDQFQMIYDFITAKDKYTFLTIDNTGKDLILKENMEAVISIGDIKDLKNESFKTFVNTEGEISPLTPNSNTKSKKSM